MFLVSITLADNMGVFRDGFVYYNNEKGELPVQDKNEINNILSGKFNNGLVTFQNIYTNATISSKYIESYMVREVEDHEFKKGDNK